MTRLAGLVLLAAVGLSGTVVHASTSLAVAESPGVGDGLGCVEPPPTPTPRPQPSLVPVEASPNVASPTPLPASPNVASPTPLPAPPSVAPTWAPTPTPYRPLGVDASVWNGSVAWSRVRAAGVRFAYVKASQGTAITDARYARNIARARAQGLSVGSYHFFDYRYPGRAQADRFVAEMARRDALEDSLPPAVDVECFDRFGPADQAYARTELRAFADRMLELTGHEVMVYTGRWAWREVTGDAATFGDLPLWIACWGCSRPSLPPGWSEWLFWQTGSLRIPGVGRMGESVHRGTDTDVLTLRADRTP